MLPLRIGIFGAKFGTQLCSRREKPKYAPIKQLRKMDNCPNGTTPNKLLER